MDAETSSILAGPLEVFHQALSVHVCVVHASGLTPPPWRAGIAIDGHTIVQFMFSSNSQATPAVHSLASTFLSAQSGEIWKWCLLRHLAGLLFSQL